MSGYSTANDGLPGQKLCKQCVTKYEKLTEPP